MQRWQHHACYSGKPAELMQLRAELQQALEDSSQQRDRAARLEEKLRQSRHDSDKSGSLAAELSSECARLKVALSWRSILQATNICAPV